MFLSPEPDGAVRASPGLPQPQAPAPGHLAPRVPAVPFLPEDTSTTHTQTSRVDTNLLIGNCLSALHMCLHGQAHTRISSGPCTQLLTHLHSNSHNTCQEHVCTHTHAHTLTHTPSVDNTQDACLQGKGLPDAATPCRTPPHTEDPWAAEGGAVRNTDLCGMGETARCVACPELSRQELRLSIETTSQIESDNQAFIHYCNSLARGQEKPLAPSHHLLLPWKGRQGRWCADGEAVPLQRGPQTEVCCCPADLGSGEHGKY